MSTLNVPIQINGNISKDGAPNTFTLLERELYVDKSGYLYFGKNNTNNNIKCKQSDTALNLSGNWAYVNNTTEEAKFGKVVINNSGDQTHIIGDNTSNVKKCYIRNFIATNFSLQNSDIINLNKLVLNSSMCGKTLPTTGVDKQVFFLMS